MKIKRIYTCEPIRFLCFSRLAIRFLGHKLLFTSFSDSISDKNTVGSVCSVQINRRSVVIKHVGIINHSGGWRALFHGESHQSYQKKMVFMWQIRRKPEAKSIPNCFSVENDLQGHPNRFFEASVLFLEDRCHFPSTVWGPSSFPFLLHSKFTYLL